MPPLPFDLASLWDLPASEFNKFSKLVFDWQVDHNQVYHQWVSLMQKNRGQHFDMNQIPFLPISFFKSHSVVVGETPSLYFESSGTTQDVVSKHWITAPSIYEQSFRKCFNQFYGAPTDWCIIGLLPSYLEKGHSSLVYMVDQFIKDSGHPQSDFYLYDFARLATVLKKLDSEGQKVWLIGVSYALLDFCKEFPQNLNNTVIIETGGMKGRKEELTRSELHEILTKGFGVSTIQSEYGMTELLSQCYSISNGVFKCPPWMRVLISDLDDPTELKKQGKGILHIIDLANLYSCSFIATQDIGEVFEDGSFTVLGRVEASDRRGCSLLVV